MDRLFSTILTNFKPILIVLALFLVSSNFKKLFQTFNSENDDLDVDDLLNENGATITDTQAKVIADSLYSATVTANSGWGGTDEDLIYSNFDKLNNQEDFNKVFNAFGRRQYSFTWGNQGDPLSSGKHDLITILSAELNQAEQEYIRTKYPHLRVF